MSIVSSPELLVLHAVRIQGMTDVGAISRRFSLDRDTAEEMLLDFEAYGWVQRAEFAGLSGWGLTEAGRRQGMRLLTAELDEAGARDAVTAAHEDFVELNDRLLQSIAKWQIRPTRADPLATNDHTDWPWDEDILKSLAVLSRRLRPIGEQLAAALSRFDGYPDRFAAALDRVDSGERRYVDAPKIDSCHTVWFELHEDLLATLSLERGGGH